MISLGAIVRDEDLLDDYQSVARDKAEEFLIESAYTEDELEDSPEFDMLIQYAVKKLVNKFKHNVNYSASNQVYSWYDKLENAGLMSPMLDAVHYALVDFKKQYDHTGKAAIKTLHDSAYYAGDEPEILWKGPLPLLYALPESPAFQVK
mgnify:CR=1 FL=1